MEKFVPYEKLSKKKQRELNAMKRGTWGGLNPVTRKPENSKAYNRKTARRWKDDSSFEPFLLVFKALFLWHGRCGKSTQRPCKFPDCQENAGGKRRYRADGFCRCRRRP